MSIQEKYSGLKPLPADIQSRLDTLQTLLPKYPVLLCYLFGSAASSPASAMDIDLAILPDEGFSDSLFYADISQTLSTDRLEIVDLRIAPYTLQFEIIRTGKCLYSRSEDIRLQYERTARFHYRDYLLRLHQQEKILYEKFGK